MDGCPPPAHGSSIMLLLNESTVEVSCLPEGIGANAGNRLD